MLLKLGGIRVPLIAGGRSFDPALAEAALKKGRADFVFMGRGLLAQPDLPNLIREGRQGSARPCIGCGRCVDNQLRLREVAICSGNPVLGRGKNDYSIPLAAVRRRVLVVGGGVAGMEAARVAALRGHEVVLAERGIRLGGQLAQAVLPPHKGNLLPLLPYYERQLKDLGVKIVLRAELGAAESIAGGYDAVLCATGLVPARLQIPGFDLPHVMNAKAALSGAAQAGQASAKGGKRVAIIGGGLIGCETADLLLRRRHRVSIVEMLDGLALKMTGSARRILLGHLDILGVRSYVGHRCLEIKEHSVVIADSRGQQMELEADTVLIAVGDRPDRTLYDSLVGLVPTLSLLGDASRPEGIAEAVSSGYFAAMGI